MPTFKELGLHPKLVRSVTAKGYGEPTSIQKEAIPAVLAGRDVMGGSQTGTGKTAAFALPILQKLSEREAKSHGPRALIVVPTRELAAQVEASVFRYSKGLRIPSVAIYGGVGFPPQVRKLRQGVGIVVATPGRLLDHAEQGTIRLSEIEILVLDEADRMLDMGFMPDIRRIIDLLPVKRQNLMFSATYPDEIRNLARDLLQNPLRIEVSGRNTAAERVNQVVHPVERSRKRELLTKLIGDGNWRQVLVFSRTRHGADRLSRQLRTHDIRAVAIHGDKTQGQRTRALEEFKRGEVRVLVATDVASRGLDIRQLPHVVNFELPDVAEDYIHRIGRTGRAGEEGDAHSLVCGAERKKLLEIETLLKQHIRREVVDGFEGEEIEMSTRRTRKRPEKKKSPIEKSTAKDVSETPAKPKRKESTAERRRRKPKWSRARKRAAKMARGESGKAAKRSKNRK